MRLGFDCLFLVKGTHDSIYEALPGFRALYFTWVSTLTAHHLPHSADEEGKAKRRGAQGLRASKRWGQASGAALSPQSGLVTPPLSCPENVHLGRPGRLGGGLGGVSRLQRLS